MIKNKFFPLLVASLLIPLAVNTSLNMKEVSGVQPSYEDLLLSTPCTLNDDFTYQEISRLDLNASEVMDMVLNVKALAILSSQTLPAVDMTLL